MPTKNGGGNVPENYDTKTGRYIKGDSWKNKRIEIKFADGTTKSLFCASEDNPLEVGPRDDDNTKFDKLFTVPLIIKNIDAWTEPLRLLGCEIVDCGFGDSKIDEGLGIDFRVEFKNKKGELRYMNIDFKLLKLPLLGWNKYNNPTLPLHLFKKEKELSISDKWTGNYIDADAQFLNKNHINNFYVFALPNFGMKMKQEEILNRLENGENINDIYSELETVKFITIPTQIIKEAIFNNLFGEKGEEGLRTDALKQHKQVQEENFMGLTKLGENTYSSTHNTRWGPYDFVTNKYEGYKVDTSIILSPQLFKTLFLKRNFDRELKKYEIKY